MEEVEKMIEEGNYEGAFERASGYALSIGRRFYVEGLDRDDIDNEVLYTLWQAILSYRKGGEASFKTYLGRCISNNLMIMVYHRKRKKRSPDEDALQSAFPPSYHPKLDERLDLYFFLPKLLPPHLAPLFKEFLRCGSFTEAGDYLGYSYNETRYLRRQIIDHLKRKW